MGFFVVIVVFFAPFVTGAVLGWRAVRGGLHGAWAVAAWIGLAGNLAVVRELENFGDAYGPRRLKEAAHLAPLVDNRPRSAAVAG